MPASQEVSIGLGLKANIEPVAEPEHVFFTDQKPKFKATIKNVGENLFLSGSKFKTVFKITGSGDSYAQVFIHELDEPLEIGEERSWRFGNRLLGYEGHAVVGFNQGGARGSGGSDGYTARINSRPNVSEPAYTFSVWDESQYKALHTIPLKWQRRAFWLSVALLVIAVAQITFFGLQLLGVV